MANRDPNTENDMVDVYKAALLESKKSKKRREEEEEEEGEEEEEEEEESSKSKKKKMEEEAEELDEISAMKLDAYRKNTKAAGANKDMIQRDVYRDRADELIKQKTGSYNPSKLSLLKSKIKDKFSEEADLEEETLAASSLHPGAKSISDPKSKISAMNAVMGMMSGMGKSDAIEFFNKVQSQFGPGKDYGVGDNSAQNSSSIDMKASDAVSSKGPKTAYPMPKLNVKEDVEEMFNGQDLSEEFKENAATLFEAAINARLSVEIARLEESYEEAIVEELNSFNEAINDKLDSYLDYVVENWMKENAVAIESSLRNELMEDFINGLKGLFEEHYISVPENKVDVLEAMAAKVEALEQKLDESIQENSELKSELVESAAKDIFVELASDLALTQQEKFIALAEGIEFDGDLDIYEKKLRIIKENYFKTETTSYNSNIEEETFEGDVVKTTTVDPTVGRYLQAISRTVKK